jgi:hypothetical protein
MVLIDTAAGPDLESAVDTRTMSIAIVIRRARRVEARSNSSGSTRGAGVSVMPRSTEQARQFVLGPSREHDPQPGS